MKQQEDQHRNERSSEAVTETRNRKIPNRSISVYADKWKNLPILYSTWEDENYIQKHPKIIKR